jgi:hypothetical protein
VGQHSEELPYLPPGPTFLPNSSVSSKDGAEGVKSTSVSDEDGFAKPGSALLEFDSSESEESESLELEVRGPLLLDSMLKGSDSPDSDSAESESSDSVSDDLDRMIQGPLLRPPAA